jgi:hypothetical protein
LLWYIGLLEASRSAISLPEPQPNLQPPITSVSQALEYKARLEAIEPNVKFLMSLYVSSDMPICSYVIVVLTVPSFILLSHPMLLPKLQLLVSPG